MGKYIGRRVDIGVAVEDIRGTAKTAQLAVPKVNYDFFDKVDKAVSEEGLGNIPGFGNQSIVTSKRSEGTIEAEMNARSFPMFMEATFGALGSAAQGAGYKHTATLLNSNQHPTLSVHISEDNGDRVIRGAMVDNLQFSFSPEGIVMFTCGMKGMALDDDVYSATYAEDYKFVGRDSEVKIAEDTASLAASTAICLKEVTVTINKNTEFDLVTCSLEPEDILNQQMTIEGTLNLNYEDNTYRDYMLAGTYRAMSIKLTDTRDDLGAGLYPEFYLELPRVDFSEWERPTSNNEIVKQTINFRALYDLDTSKLFSSCYMINNVVSY